MSNQQNTQWGYLHSLLTSLIASLIGLLGLLENVQCSCNQASVPSSRLEIEMLANKPFLKDPEREFDLIIKPTGDNTLPQLTDWKLKAQFVEQETFGRDAQKNSCLAYKHGADKPNFNTSFVLPLSTYATTYETEKGSAEEQTELRIPIVLQPANQATKLKVGIELINPQGHTLQTLEVSWIKNELLISDLITPLGTQGSASLTLKNTKDIPLTTGKIILDLKSEYGETLQFSTTNTSPSTLEEVWDHHPRLEPGAETSPISFQLNKPTGREGLPKLTITVSQEDGKVLATKTVPYPPLQAHVSPSTQPQVPKEKQEQPEAIAAPTTPPFQLQMWLVQMTHKKFKLFVSNKGQQVSKNTLQLVKLKYDIQGTGDLTNIRFKRGSLADINGASLAELLGSGLQEGQTKEVEIILVPANADSLAIQLFLEGAPNASQAHFNWHKKEKSTKNKNKEEKLEKLQANMEKPTEGLQEKPEEVKEKTSLSLPNLFIQTKASKSIYAKKFKLVLTNQGESISEEAMRHVKLYYILQGTGDRTHTYLKRRGAPQEDINGKSLLAFIKSGLDQGQTKEFELIIETGNARTLDIHITLAGTQHHASATYTWVSKEELKEKAPSIKSKESTRQATRKLQPEGQASSKQQEQIQEPASDLQEMLTDEEIQKHASDLQKATGQASIQESRQAQESLATNPQEEIKEAIQEECTSDSKAAEQVPNTAPEQAQEPASDLQELSAKDEEEFLQIRKNLERLEKARIEGEARLRMRCQELIENRDAINKLLKDQEEQRKPWYEKLCKNLFK